MPSTGNSKKWLHLVRAEVEGGTIQSDNACSAGQVVAQIDSSYTMSTEAVDLRVHTKSEYICDQWVLAVY